jgi:hypothetical protein
MGFHADQEAMRILALSIDAARLGQLALRDPAAARPAVASREPVDEQTPGG